MPRKPREEVAGGIFHVWARALDRRPLFVDDGDCQVYLVMMRGVVHAFGWRVLAYCLMTNHVHLVIETPYPNLGEGMQRLHGRFAIYYNRRYERLGHLFEKRYGHNRIADDAHLKVALDYVAANPVEGGLCTRPEDWRRSSFASAARSREAYGVDFGRLDQLLGRVDTVNLSEDRYVERQFGEAACAAAPSLA
jgi:REP element-mobilizing transposase RayT